jgi:hypothetical protein
MPMINFHPLRRLKQRSNSWSEQKTTGHVTGAGARSCAILALLMSGVVSTGTVKAAETSAAEKQEAAKRSAWRESMSHAPVTKKGCYKASYPDTTWHEVACGPVRHKPLLPAREGEQRELDVVGGASNDVSAQAPTGHITSATGSFDSFSVTSENVSDPLSTCSAPTVPGAANTFSLQLNTNYSPKSPQAQICNGGTSQCQAWQQFAYVSEGANQGQLFMQYWLINYATENNHTCPVGWDFYDNKNTCKNPPTHQYDCYTSTATTWIDPVPLIGAVGNMSLVGTTTTGGNDTAILFSSSGVEAGMATNDDNVVNLPEFWTVAEFNIFGDDLGHRADFNSGATIVPRTKIVYGGKTKPNCKSISFTGETNNLSFGPTPPAVSPPGPAVFFTESSAGGAPSACAAASAIGDTHVHPFNGVTEYDFQAYGDFVLVDAGPDFLVHTRQTKGPPQYPGTATNTAVAVMMGKTRVAVYLQPARLVIDGKTNDLADGKAVFLPAGVQVTRHGAEYRISDDSGNWVIADLVKNGSEPLWISVTVYLGRAPDKTVRGLLGNPADKADEITTAKGKVLKVPVAVKDLYGAYADSWRVDPAKSLFVELPPAPAGAPAKPLTARDLPAAEKAHAEQVCKAAGVKNEALLDDCVLDTTVLKDDDAVKVFTKIAAPKLVITLK